MQPSSGGEALADQRYFVENCREVPKKRRWDEVIPPYSWLHSEKSRGGCSSVRPPRFVGTAIGRPFFAWHLVLCVDQPVDEMTDVFTPLGGAGEIRVGKGLEYVRDDADTKNACHEDLRQGGPKRAVGHADAFFFAACCRAFP